MISEEIKLKIERFEELQRKGWFDKYIKHIKEIKLLNKIINDYFFTEAICKHCGNKRKNHIYFKWCYRVRGGDNYTGNEFELMIK